MMEAHNLMVALFHVTIELILPILSLLIPALCAIFVLMKWGDYRLFTKMIITLLAVCSVAAHASGAVVSSEIKDFAVIVTTVLLTLRD